MSEIERMARESDAEFARLTGIIFDQIKLIAALEAALKPFARLAEFVTETQRDSRPVVFGMDNVVAQRLTIGHLRAARAAISPAHSGPAEPIENKGGGQ